MAASDKLAIVVRNVGVQYDLRFSRATTVKAVVSKAMSPRKWKQQRGDVKFWALRDVSFAVKQGEMLGIIGPNGAGKSTLMLCLAGLLPPDKGTIRTYGRTSSLVTLGTGFDIEWTGRENIYLNAAFLGIPRVLIDERVDEIIAYSELGRFIDAPLRTYSSGMRARLAFSIAVLLDPEILLLDEVLSGVGDVAFRAKSEQTMKELMGKAKALVVVTHSTAFVENFCTKAIWIQNGEVEGFGEPAAVVDAYLEHASRRQGPVREIEPGAAKPVVDTNAKPLDTRGVSLE